MNHDRQPLQFSDRQAVLWTPLRPNFGAVRIVRIVRPSRWSQGAGWSPCCLIQGDVQEYTKKAKIFLTGFGTGAAVGNHVTAQPKLIKI